MTQVTIQTTYEVPDAVVAKGVDVILQYTQTRPSRIVDRAVDAVATADQMVAAALDELNTN